MFTLQNKPPFALWIFQAVHGGFDKDGCNDVEHAEYHHHHTCDSPKRSRKGEVSQEKLWEANSVVQNGEHVKAARRAYTQVYKYTVQIETKSATMCYVRTVKTADDQN